MRIGAPRRENLKRYLSEHPEMELYAGQDQDGHPSYSEKRASVREDRQLAIWTDKEDEELAKLVAIRKSGRHACICST